jgi:hypothetical protein
VNEALGALDGDFAVHTGFGRPSIAP